MNLLTPTFQPRRSTKLNQALRAAGFVSGENGFQSGDVTFIHGSSLSTFVAPDRAPQGAEPNDLGKPGLWKRVNTGSQPQQICSLPAGAIDAALDGESFDSTDLDSEQVIHKVIQWALVSRNGSVPSGWLAPQKTLVESWFEPGKLSVVAGPVVCQGELITTERCLALRFPILPHLPADLPATRIAWLHTLLEEAQGRWHLPRLGVLDTVDGAAVMAEMNFTGAPPEILEDLFVNGLDALRWVVELLAEPADWLADVNVTSEILAI